MSETAKGIFEADVGQFVAALQQLESRIDALDAKLAGASGRMSSSFAMMDGASARSAASMDGAARAGDRHRVSLSGLGHGVFVANEAIRLLLSSTTFLDKQLNFLAPTTRGVIGNVQQVTAHVLVFDTILKMVTGTLGPVQAGLGFMAAKSIDTTKTYQTLTSASGALARSTGMVGQAFTHAGAEAATAVGTAASSIMAKLGPFIIVVAAIMLVVKTLGLIKKGVQGAADLEDLRTSFATLTNDTQGANDAIAEFVKWSDETPFDAMDLKGAARDLLAYGFNLKELIPTMTDVGDLAATFPNRSIADVASAFGQIKVGNFANAFQNLRTLGIKKGDLTGEGLEFDKNNQYTGSIEKAMTAVHNIVRRKFGGAMKDLSTTWNGTLAHLGSKVAILFREFGAPIMQALKPGLTAGVAMISSLGPAARSIGTVFAAVFSSAMGVGAILVRVGRIVWNSLIAPFAIAGRQIAGVFKEIWGIVGQVARLLGGGLTLAFVGLGAVVKPVLTFFMVVLAHILNGVAKLLGMLRNAIEALGTLVGIAPFLVPKSADPKRTGGREEKKEDDAKTKKEKAPEMSSRRQLGAGSMNSGVFNFAAQDPLLVQANRQTVIQEKLLAILSRPSSATGGTEMPALET